MQPLRLTLLIVGLVFLIGLAWWELRRPHQVRGSDLPRPGPDPLERMPERPAERSADWDAPALELPRMSARDPEAELPVIEVDPIDFAALEARAEGSDPDADPDADVGADPAPQPAVEAAASMHGPAVTPAPAMDGMDGMDSNDGMDGMDSNDGMDGMEGLLAELGASQTPDPPISDITESFRDGLLADEHFAVDSVTVRILDAPQMASRFAPPAAAEAAPIAAPASLPEVPATPVVVDWPAGDASQVIAVRLVSVGEKFSGRAVRLALAAEGFVLGQFSIFHKPAADGRALLSIANLNKPGTFDGQAIDLQRYGGLNLFTVLPGPMPGPQAVDELLACAQVLAQRLRGALQDGRGESLSPARTAVMRHAAAAAPT